MQLMGWDGCGRMHKMRCDAMRWMHKMRWMRQDAMDAAGCIICGMDGTDAAGCIR